MVENPKYNTNYSYRRLVIQYDPVIGYRFIPNIYSRIKHKNYTYVIETNEQGFRDNASFYDKRNNGKLNVLALGDSYLAGDAISNNERFMDIISERFNINVYNMGLPGSGVDQQLLIQEKIASQYNYDILVIAPYLHNLNRNLKSKMYVRDWASRKQIDINKPFFKLINGKTLKLYNNPVPKSKHFFIEDNFEDDYFSKTKRNIQNRFPTVHDRLHRMRKAYYNFAYHHNLIKADVAYADRESYGWQLMRAIFERMIENAGTRQVVIIPIPFNIHIRSGGYPFYLDRFKELTRPNVSIVDVLPALKSVPKDEIEELFVPDNGHLSAKANQIEADVCTSLFSKLIGSQNNKVY